MGEGKKEIVFSAAPLCMHDKEKGLFVCLLLLTSVSIFTKSGVVCLLLHITAFNLILEQCNPVPLITIERT